MTLSFHKVNFTAQEVLDLLEEFEEGHSLGDFESEFIRRAEARSREEAPMIEEPDYNSYQITVTVRDISKKDALELGRSFAAAAMGKPGKDGERIETDVGVTVAHVKAWTV